MIKVFQDVFPNVLEAKVNEFMAQHTDAKVINSYVINETMVVVVQYTESSSESSTTN